MRPKARRSTRTAPSASAFYSSSRCSPSATPSRSSNRNRLPYIIKPYHLHDFLGKVSELLVETGTLVNPIRGIGDFNGAGRRQQGVRDARKKRSSMFAARDDYQMSEEEMLEWERSEEEARKKREKEIWDREHL